MSDTYSYEVLEPGGHARLVGNVLDRISRASSNPASAVGSAAAMLGDPETASWMECTTAADGAALIESVHGNTLRWNQLINAGQVSITTNGLTVTTVTNGKYTVVGTAEGVSTNAWFAGGWLSTTPLFTVKAGHKYIAKDCTTFSSEADGRRGWNCDINSAYYFTPSSDIDITCVRFPRVVAGNTYNTTVYPQLFDLTQMFGAGNEPSTVAEFEALFPNTYYPYDAGSLLPVRMEGVETVAADESWTSQLTIPAATYFPQGMRSAGSVADELTETAAITRVGAVDLGTLTWTYNANWNGGPAFAASITGNEQAQPQNVANIQCAKYETVSRNYLYDNPTSTGIGLYNSSLSVRDSTYTDAAAFKTAMSGVMLHYALATPTTTPIDPPLPLSYRTGAGGTERVMVASGTTSAPPIFVTRYPLDPADLAASIAPVDGPIAKTNHQVGDLLMLGFTLCKATQVIVTGETIAIGTNVTRTTVAAEMAALSE